MLWFFFTEFVFLDSLNHENLSTHSDFACGYSGDLRGQKGKFFDLHVFCLRNRFMLVIICYLIYHCLENSGQS